MKEDCEGSEKDDEYHGKQQGKRVGKSVVRKNIESGAAQRGQNINVLAQYRRNLTTADVAEHSPADAADAAAEDQKCDIGIFLRLQSGFHAEHAKDGEPDGIGKIDEKVMAVYLEKLRKPFMKGKVKEDQRGTNADQTEDSVLIVPQNVRRDAKRQVAEKSAAEGGQEREDERADSIGSFPHGTDGGGNGKGYHGDIFHNLNQMVHGRKPPDDVESWSLAQALLRLLFWMQKTETGAFWNVLLTKVRFSRIIWKRKTAPRGAAFRWGLSSCRALPDS